MAEFNITIKGLNEMRQAIKRNPQRVLKEVRNFLTEGIAIYNRGIIRSPWKMGGEGGGAPVAMINSSRKGVMKESGNLRDTHRKQITPWSASIFPTAPYAPYVHGIEGYPRKRSYQLRPWLDHVFEDKKVWVEALEVVLLKNIVEDLAK